jgi:hypothetical protein
MRFIAIADIQPGTSVRLGGLVATVAASELKRVARTYLGTEVYKLKKDACLEALEAVLADPDRLRALAAKLPEFDRFALYLLKRAGGSTTAGELSAVLRVAGFPFEDRSRLGVKEFLAPMWDLADRGIALPTRAQRLTWRSYSSDRSHDDAMMTVVADVRLLRQVSPVAPRPLPIEPAVPPQSPVRSTRPAAVVLGLSATTEAVARIGGLPLTSQGHPAKAGIKRLLRALGLGQDRLAEASFSLAILAAAGVLMYEQKARLLQVVEAGRQRLQEPFERQAAGWAEAYGRVVGWDECEPEEYYL